MWKFLTFESFITQDILIIIYYMGVFFLPLMLWIYRENLKSFLGLYRSQNRLLYLIIAFVLFLMMQLMWRMMFEAMIGYFDMHNYLQILAKEKI